MTEKVNAESECEVTIKIPYTKETLKRLFKAEKELHEAGIHFDTGALVQENIREWSFDWSLTGAKVVFIRMKNGDKGENKPWLNAGE